MGLTLGNDHPARAPRPAFFQEIRRIRAAVRRVLEATETELESRPFLREMTRQVGIPYCEWPGLTPYRDHINAHQLGIVQYPSEYVDFLLLLRGRRIRSFCEIGVYVGGFSALTAAYLLRTCGLQEYHCVDRKLVFADLSHYSRQLPLVCHMPATSDSLKGRQFDAVFCDGEHSYEWTRRDFLNLARHAGIYCQHDIRGHEYDRLGGGVTSFWAEFKRGHRDKCTILEITHAAPAWMGIGVGFLNHPL